MCVHLYMLAYITRSSRWKSQIARYGTDLNAFHSYIGHITTLERIKCNLMWTRIYTQHMRSTFSHTREKLTEGCIRLAIVQKVNFTKQFTHMGPWSQTCLFFSSDGHTAIGLNRRTLYSHKWQEQKLCVQNFENYVFSLDERCFAQVRNEFCLNLHRTWWESVIYWTSFSYICWTYSADMESGLTPLPYTWRELILSELANRRRNWHLLKSHIERKCLKHYWFITRSI